LLFDPQKQWYTFTMLSFGFCRYFQRYLIIYFEENMENFQTNQTANGKHVSLVTLFFVMYIQKRPKSVTTSCLLARCHAFVAGIV